jgi:hypothetical protein
VHFQKLKRAKVIPRESIVVLKNCPSGERDEGILIGDRATSRLNVL